LSLLRPKGVEGADRVVLGQSDDPLGQVTHVDHLHRVGGLAGDQDLLMVADGLRDPHRPVGVAVGRVAGADDVARTHDRHAPRHRLLGRLLAEGLESAVELLHLLVGRVGHRGQGGIFVLVGRGVVGVDADGRDEDVLPAVIRQH